MDTSASPKMPHAKSEEDLAVRRPSVKSKHFKHGNPVAKQPEKATSVTGSSISSHDDAFGA